MVFLDFAAVCSDVCVCVCVWLCVLCCVCLVAGCMLCGFDAIAVVVVVVDSRSALEELLRGS